MAVRALEWAPCTTVVSVWMPQLEDSERATPEWLILGAPPLCLWEWCGLRVCSSVLVGEACPQLGFSPRKAQKCRTGTGDKLERSGFLC